PSDKDQVPRWVMDELLDRLRRREDEAAGADQICRGTLLSRQQYLHETNVEGYLDAREFESKDWTGDQAYPVRYPARSEGQDDAQGARRRRRPCPRRRRLGSERLRRGRREGLRRRIRGGPTAALRRGGFESLRRRLHQRRAEAGEGPLPSAHEAPHRASALLA